MMINNNYAEQIAIAKANKASIVNFDNNMPISTSISGGRTQDTVSISPQAQALANGKSYQETAPTYIKPVTARALLATNQAEGQITETPTDSRFNDMMQNILDKRLGVDREKLKELDAMMEEIANNENMSPEEKAEALEKLAEMREKIIQESIELKDIAQQSFQE